MERVGIHLNSRPSRELASPYLASKVYPRDHHRNPPYPKSRPPRGAAVGAGNRKGGKEATSFWVAKKRGEKVHAILAQTFTEPQCQRMYSNACPYPNDTSTPEPAKHYRLIHSDRSQVRALLFFVFIATALRRMFD